MSNSQCGISVIIPVLHEAERINNCLSHLKSQFDNNFCQIIVVDADQNGSTINSITDNNILTVTCEKGRAGQMNKGAKLAAGDNLLFLHADTTLPPGALQKIIGVLDNPRYVAGAFNLAIDSNRVSLKLVAACASLRCHLTRIPYGDQAVFIRKDYFEKIGLFEEIELMEDFELMRRIKKRGDRIYIIPEKVITSARRWLNEGVFYTTLRNWFLVLLYRLGISPDKLKKFYRSTYVSSER